MNFLAFFCLFFAQYLSGAGVLRLFKLQLNALAMFSLSVITGTVLISLAPCFMQLFHVPFSPGNVIATTAIFTAIYALPLVIMFRKPQFGKVEMPKLYEIPFILVFLFLIATSAWRCFYFPPTPRDVLAGSEMIAEFTIREKTMLNSVYSIDLHTTNNQYKSPFLTSLQILYKMFVTPTGQVWLTPLSIAFVLFLYNVLRQRLHAFLACVVLLTFFSSPDVFAYSYIILYDYSNMVLFFCGFYFLMQFLQHGRNNEFALSVLLFGFATYIRVETLVLVGMASLMLIYSYFRQKQPVVKMAIHAGILVAASAFFYVLCMKVFVDNFVPVKMDTGAMVNKNLSDISPFTNRLSAMFSDLIFADKGKLVYGLFFYFFLTLLAIDLVFTRKVSREGRMALYAVSVVVLGLAFLGYALPLFDLMNTTKRGMFKAVPLAILYMANSTVLANLSNYLKKKESGIKDEPALATNIGKPVSKTPAPKGKK